MPLLEKLFFNNNITPDISKRINIAKTIFDQYYTYHKDVSFRIVGSTISNYSLKKTSDLDLQVISDQILIPTDMIKSFGMVSNNIAKQYKNGAIDIVALKCIQNSIPTSLQFIHPKTLQKLISLQKNHLKIFRSTPTRIIATQYSSEGESWTKLQQLPYSYGYLLIVPINQETRGKFMMNLYHHMLINGINLNDIHDIKKIQTDLLGKIVSTCNKQHDLFRILGFRAQKWSDEYKQYIIRLSQLDSVRKSLC